MSEACNEALGLHVAGGRCGKGVSPFNEIDRLNHTTS